MALLYNAFPQLPAFWDIKAVPSSIKEPVVKPKLPRFPLFHQFDQIRSARIFSLKVPYLIFDVGRNFTPLESRSLIGYCQLALATKGVSNLIGFSRSILEDEVELRQQFLPSRLSATNSFLSIKQETTGLLHLVSTTILDLYSKRKLPLLELFFFTISNSLIRRS